MKRQKTIYTNTNEPGSFSYYVENIKENIEHEEDVLADDVDEVKDEFVNDWPKYDSEWDNGNRGMFEYWNYFRWILNAAFIGCPTFVVTWIFIGLNIFESIAWNRVWANGNIFLISKTFYLIVQSLMLLPLIFEIDVYLRHMKFFRFISLFFAVLYNTLYFSVFGIWWY